MRVRYLSIMAALIFLLMGAFACSPVEKKSFEGASCTKSSDCAGSLSCIEQVCVEPSVDAGAPQDAVLADVGPDLTDEGPSPTDEGPSPTDEGPSPTDEGPSPTDEGPSPTDEGPSPTDEGPSPTDEGPSPNDAGPNDTTPPILEACTNTEDANLLTQGSFEYEGKPYDNLQSALFYIGYDCVLQEPAAVISGNCDTVTDCVQEQASLSSECSTCFGEVVCCGATNCNFECAFAADDDCIACAKEECQDSFQACSGLLWDNVF